MRYQLGSADLLRCLMASEPTDATRPAVDSVGGALDQVGDRWTFLVLREAFLGVRRFGEMQRNLGVARTVLTSRLKRLTADGILERVAYRTDPVWYEYRLTQKGLDLYPAIVALLQWGDRYVQPGEPPLRLRHLDCGELAQARLDCGECGRPMHARNTRPARDA